MITALPQQWRARANDLEKFAAPAACAFRECAEQLEEVLDGASDSVSLKQAAELGGYSVDALQRMVASGRVANAGRKGKPRISRLEVPIKPGFRPAPCSPNQRTPNMSRSAVVASVIGGGTR